MADLHFMGTPGEWKLRQNETIGDSVHNTQYYEIVTPVINGNHVNQIATCSFRQAKEPFSMSLEEIKANANLIQSAPRVLEALMGAYYTINNLLPDVLMSDDAKDVVRNQQRNRKQVIKEALGHG